jgi:hypothetical protein
MTRSAEGRAWRPTRSDTLRGDLGVRNLLKQLRPLADVVLAPFAVPAALLMKLIRRVGVDHLPLCKRVLLGVGVFPIRSHYYEPQFDMRGQPRIDTGDRDLPGLDMNVRRQLAVLEHFRFGSELERLDGPLADGRPFQFANGFFGTGDADYWYQIIRTRRPRRLIEIGSGQSTRIAIAAIDQNRRIDPEYSCWHVCVEPYENPWLEATGVELVRTRVEELDPSFFSSLGAGDILFIDSSHVIRPTGDVLFEYLQLLPRLDIGVLVHIHDIFTPRQYPASWIVDEVKFWNEQYLVEAFLSHNTSWEITGALNHLYHRHRDQLRLACPHLSDKQEPASFYIERVR